MRTRLVACVVLGLVAVVGGVQAAAAQSQAAAPIQLRIVATSRPQVQFGDSARMWQSGGAMSSGDVTPTSISGFNLD